MTRQTTEKKTDTGTTPVQKDQSGTNQSDAWALTIQNPIDVPRAIHREIC